MFVSENSAIIGICLFDTMQKTALTIRIADRALSDLQSRKDEPLRRHILHMETKITACRKDIS